MRAEAAAFDGLLAASRSRRFCAEAHSAARIFDPAGDSVDIAQSSVERSGGLTSRT